MARASKLREESRQGTGKYKGITCEQRSKSAEKRDNGQEHKARQGPREIDSKNSRKGDALIRGKISYR